MLKVHRKNSGDAMVLCLQGAIVRGEIKTLRDAVLALSEASAVVLDLKRVSRVDAGGLGVLLELREQALSKGQEFKLINVNKLVEQVLAISHLNSVFEIPPERDVALGAVHGRPITLVEPAPCV